jgi:ABC-type branched-subunit amino acid transport system ATPase component/ABC-type branched-subunit amino acid transport system permease subunit
MTLLDKFAPPAQAQPGGDEMVPPSTTAQPVASSLRHIGSIVLMVVLIGWISVFPNYLVYTLTAAIPVAFAGLGLLVLQGWSRELSLATAGLFATSLYTYGYFARPDAPESTLDKEGLGIPWVIAALMAIGIVTLLMAVIAGASVKLPGIYLVILTLGLQLGIERAIFPIGQLSGGLSGGNGGAPLSTPRPEFFGLDIESDNAFYLFCLGWLAVTLVALVRLRHSPTGLAFLLVGSDRQAAAAVGIPPAKFRLLAFVTSGLLAGMGGVMACWLFVTPPVNLQYTVVTSLLMLSIPVLAGVDSIAWVLVVCAALQVIPVSLERYHIPIEALAGGALLMGAAFGARGIGGRCKDLTRRIKYGDRQTRTRRVKHSADILREHSGLGLEDDDFKLSKEQRAACLAVLEQWLPPRPQNPVAAQTYDVRRSFGGVRALQGASIVVPAGEMVGLIGPNGAGKTTLFDVVSGFTVPDSGRVELFGQDVTKTKPWDRSKLGMARTFQTTRVITELTVGENMLAGAYTQIKPTVWSFLLGRPGAWKEIRRAEEAAWAAARLLDVDRYWDERTGTLEFSARRRAEIGRALLSGPRLLLLDEPAAGLDPASSSAMFSLIRRLHKDLGLTVLLVEHYVKAVLDTCDLVYVLAEGSVLSQGTPTQVANDPEVRDRYLGTRMLYLTTTEGDTGGLTDEEFAADEQSSPAH